ncbi:ParB/RepB/Spo0J family partition protein [Zavarzinia sp. CC-PAN008]|uniref:ParB/RepB/Spo0J family partition protein n=1 Tax=Zavarzinia sp. CC-PAN008 TaxID=3243332 RepID=UPI003F74A248
MAEPKADNPRRRSLGRGLDFLLAEVGQAGSSDPGQAQVREVPIELVKPNPTQPRRRFDEAPLEDLVQSIRERGLLQPILVRPIRAEGAGQMYEIVAGERRWRAAQRVPLHTVPVIVKALTDAETLEAALIENVQRENLNPIEEAAGYQRLIEAFGHSQEVLAKLIGKSRAHIANTLRLMALPLPVRSMVEDGRLTAGHGRALLAVADPERLAARIVAENLSVRAVEQMAVSRETGPKRSARSAATGSGERDADTAAIEGDLSAAVGLQVAINHKPGGAGHVAITYASLDELDLICRILGRGRPED